MSASAPLPPDVETVLCAYRESLAAEQAPTLRGLYLVGSIALGDYRRGASDIDFIAVLDEDLSPGAIERLAQVHARLAQAGGPHFDGAYLPAALLHRPAPGEVSAPFVVDGRFRAGQICREANPAVWRCLARHGRTLLGAPPAELGIADDDVPLRAHQIANLQGYWSEWIVQAEAALDAKAPGEDCSAAALSWGVLGISRIASTLATGAVVSKGEAGRFALRTVPHPWHGTLDAALAIHRGGPERVPVPALRAALAYMRFVIAQAPGYQP